ncbi:hypothetical protein LCGC14_3061990, partial [marine sediment metagenome]
MPADRDELVPGPAYPMGAPHHRDTHETEVAAARRMTPLLRGCQGAVVVALRAHPAGLTTCELCEQPDLVRYDRLTVGARVTELQNHGWVRASGFKRKSWREQDMNVWVLCDPLPTTAPPQTGGSYQPATMLSPDFGGQAFLWWRPEIADRDLKLMNEAGVNWVKQAFAWETIEGAGKG